MNQLEYRKIVNLAKQEASTEIQRAKKRRNQKWMRLRGLGVNETVKV